MKANSQRLKGKNFRILHGKSLFFWILDTLLEIDAIDQVVINTDARHLLAENGLCESDRVMIRDRKPVLCGDDVSMNLILTDDIDSVAATTYLMTHTTNPLLSAATIRKALSAYQVGLAAGEADSLFAVNRVQTRFYRADGRPVNHDPENLIQTQDLEPWFEENSCLYIFNRESFAQSGARIGPQPMMYETPRLESVDIDTPEDWKMAEALASLMPPAAKAAEGTTS